MDKEYTFKTVKEMDLETTRHGQPEGPIEEGGEDAVDRAERTELDSLFAELVDVLERIDRIRPIQFLDFESEYVYNFLRLRESMDDNRIYIEVSGCYDNLPTHGAHPLRDSRNKPMLPHSTCRGVAHDAC